MNQSQNQYSCTNVSCGKLPDKGPLANPYVPYQEDAAQTYGSESGLVRGTIFPGLDLPFMNMVNSHKLSSTLLHQLQALNFAVTELGLYLDTHGSDTDALALFDQYSEMYEEALQKYEQAHGPTMQMRGGMTGSYQWSKGPWPWEYSANKEG